MIVYAIALLLALSLIIVYLWTSKQRTEKLLEQQEKRESQKVYELSVLKELQDRIGYELNVERVIDVITGSLKGLFRYSTASSMLIKDDSLVFKLYIEDPVGQKYIDQVRKSMLASLHALADGNVPGKIEENVLGRAIEAANTNPMASFFHIPLIVGNRIAGLINVSSTTPGLYRVDEMTILYQIVTQASNAVSRLQSVLTTEKGKLMATIGSLTDGVFMIDKDRKLLVINPVAKKMLGITKGDPTIVDVLASLQPKYDVVSAIESSITTKTGSDKKEVVLGQTTVEVYIHPVMDRETNSVIGASVLLQDVTLEKNVAQMKEDFTNMMVHELRAPLTAIRGASDLLLNQKQKLPPEGHDKFLKMIHDQAKKLIDDVSLLLDASKIEAHRLAVNRETVQLPQIVEQSVQVFKPQADLKAIKLFAQVADVTLSADPQMLSRVLNNLISNSLKFTNPGDSITVYGGTQERNGKHVAVIAVTDTGIGIPKDKQEKVFDKFYQVASPGSNPHFPHPTGTGLGLYIVKGIVQAHGGSVSLQSEPGRGTTITLTFPLQPAIVAKTEAQQPATTQLSPPTPLGKN